MQALLGQLSEDFSAKLAPLRAEITRLKETKAAMSLSTRQPAKLLKQVGLMHDTAYKHLVCHMQSFIQTCL